MEQEITNEVVEETVNTITEETVKKASYDGMIVGTYLGAAGMLIGGLVGQFIVPRVEKAVKKSLAKIGEKRNKHAVLTEENTVVNE